MGFRAIHLLALAAVGSLAAVAGQAGTIPTTTFDWNPLALGLNGGKFTADTLKLADYGQIVVHPVTGGFTEAGYLQVLEFALNGQNISASGFDSPYGWGAYVCKLSGDGHPGGDIERDHRNLLVCVLLAIRL